MYIRQWIVKLAKSKMLKLLEQGYFFQFCDMENLAFFPNKLVKAVKFTLEKQNPKLPNFFVKNVYIYINAGLE